VRALLDVNFLLALLQPDHAHFERAHQWWETNKVHGWASCPLTQNGFVRIVSQASYPQPLPVAHALETLSDQIVRTDHQFWPDDISLLDAELIDGARLLGPKHLTDVYLLALAVKHGGRLVTFDRGIPLRSVRRAEQRHMVVL
jgi:toxin-antitoxin system PIN domain toxin